MIFLIRSGPSHTYTAERFTDIIQGRCEFHIPVERQVLLYCYLFAYLDGATVSLFILIEQVPPHCCWLSTQNYFAFSCLDETFHKRPHAESGFTTAVYQDSVFLPRSSLYTECSQPLQTRRLTQTDEHFKETMYRPEITASFSPRQQVLQCYALKVCLVMLSCFHFFSRLSLY